MDPKKNHNNNKNRQINVINGISQSLFLPTKKNLKNLHMVKKILAPQEQEKKRKKNQIKIPKIYPHILKIIIISKKTSKNLKNLKIKKPKQ